MRILLVTYHFPPDGEIGGVRPWQIARYLPQFGVEPWVLTVEPQFAESPNPGFVAEGVPDDHILRTSVERSPLNGALGVWRVVKKLGRLRPKQDAATQVRRHTPKAAKLAGWARSLLSFPDERIGWRRPALQAATEAISRIGFNAVISTSPPRVAALIAGAVSVRHRLPWLMDLRDPWWGWYGAGRSFESPCPAVDSRQHALFRRSVSTASLVIHNTERLRELTCRLVPEAAAKTRCVPNGCDADWTRLSDAARPEKFRISYYGQVMGRRDPSAFLCGLRLWLDAVQPDPDRIQVRFVGSGFDHLRREAEKLGLWRVVEFLPPVPRREVPAHEAADFLLLLVANAQPLQIPGKAYDYMAAGRRILALVDREGATADFLRGEPGCFTVTNQDEVRNALEHFYKEYQSGAPAFVDRTALLTEMQYSRRVERFAEALREIVRS